MVRVYLYEKELKQTDDDEIPIIVYVPRKFYQEIKEEGLNKKDNLYSITVELDDCQINVNYDDGIYIE